MVTTLGEILMNVDGADKDYTVETLLGNAMIHDLSFDASQADIGELELSDTAAAMSSAKKNATQGAYERSNTKSWSKKKLGAPKQKSEKTEYSDLSETQRRERRREPLSGAYGKKGFVALTPKRKGTVVTVTPEHTVDRETGELKATDADTFKVETKKMSKMEFDGSKAKHDKIMERNSSGKFVINCAGAKTYRREAWEYMSKQKDESGELIRTEHPDARAVQLAGV